EAPFPVNAFGGPSKESGRCAKPAPLLLFPTNIGSTASVGSQANERSDQNAIRGGSPDPTYRSRNSGSRSSRETGRSHRQGDLSDVARAPCNRVSRSEVVPGRPDSRHRLFR